MKKQDIRQDNNQISQRNIIIKKHRGAVARTAEKKDKWLSDERRSFLKDLAIMAIISAVVIMGLIIYYELLK